MKKIDWNKKCTLYLMGRTPEGKALVSLNGRGMEECPCGFEGGGEYFEYPGFPRIYIGGMEDADSVPQPDAWWVEANEPIIPERTGKSYQKAPRSVQDAIGRMFELEPEFELENFVHRYWLRFLRGTKVTLEASGRDGRVEYRMKRGNKILLKTFRKEQAANKVAEVYWREEAKA